ncbi:hypothetical protein [uncultured Propionibacterium sp.]|uniref:hypothetical protein n=1 Tax=uncultured Propionibacterium sp. TaxID=218066 RepID=UPI002930E70A|nr:hypothetical protein [uncultured Propionibacterium sp.]
MSVAAYQSLNIVLSLITIAALAVLLVFILMRASGAVKVFAASGVSCLIVEMIIGHGGTLVSNRTSGTLTASAIINVFARLLFLAGIILLVYGTAKASQNHL